MFPFQPLIGPQHPLLSHLFLLVCGIYYLGINCPYHFSISELLRVTLTAQHGTESSEMDKVIYSNLHCHNELAESYQGDSTFFL